MNLADYVKLDFSKGDKEYIRFETTGETRYLRFVYESGGDEMGKDITFRRKYWDDEQKRYVYDTQEGQLVATLKCIEYDADGSNPRFVLWERSAYFCKNTLLPMWRNYPRIIDGVWKVTATSPRTKDATYALFPVTDADTLKYPIIEEEETVEVEVVPQQEKAETAPATPVRRKYWDVEE